MPTPLIGPPRGAISFAIVTRTVPVLFGRRPVGSASSSVTSRSGYCTVPLPKLGIPTSVARLLSFSAAANTSAAEAVSASIRRTTGMS